MNTFKKILETRSFTIIQFLAEDAAQVTTDKEELAALKAILNANHLDEVYAICHDQCGQPEEAIKLRQWLANRPAQNDAVLPD